MKTSKPFRLRSQGMPFKLVGSSPLNEGEEKSGGNGGGTFGILKSDSNKPEKKKETKPKVDTSKKSDKEAKQESHGVLAQDAKKEEAFNTRLDLDKKVEKEKVESKEDVKKENWADKTVSSEEGDTTALDTAQAVATSEGKRYAKSKAVEQGVKATSGQAKNLLKVGGRFMGAAGIVQMGYEAYKSGQEHSGGRVGYEKNPNWDPEVGGDKHGGRDSGAQFIPKEGKEHTDIWASGKEKTKEIQDKNRKKQEEAKDKKGWDFGGGDSSGGSGWDTSKSWGG
tara:strand:+ start:144 stop:986 length:843 start_codon:yes stop_codon:yes gene_type:complete